MGKRKEGRHAALSNAGRRVKLDLFAEPSENLGGSSEHDEDERDDDVKHQAGLPNSPSSSGQQPPNPLMLLGQHSDGELDDEPDKRLEDGIMENSMADHADQVKGPLSEVDTGERQASNLFNKLDQERDSITLNGPKNLEGIGSRETDNYVSSESDKEKDSSKTSIPGTSEVQIIGDVGSGWRIVMHEESNRYYYWNTETGETSWEVPNVLDQTSQSASDQKPAAIDYIETTIGGPLDPKSNSGIQLDDSSTAVTIKCSFGVQVRMELDKINGKGMDWMGKD